MENDDGAFNIHLPCTDPEGDRGSRPPILENHKAIGFLSNTDPHSLSQLPSQHSMLDHHQPASKTPLKWRVADRQMDGPRLVVFGSSLSSSPKKLNKKNIDIVKLDPL